MRRVVTGRAADGKSIFVSDSEIPEIVPQLAPGSAFCQVWGSDDVVTLPSDGLQPAWHGFFPPMNGFRFLVWQLGPESIALPPDFDVAGALAEIQEQLPGLTDAMEPDHPGMHTTQTIDFNFVVSGEVWLELDDGAEVKLGPGDCVVQNGTRHAWHNRTDEPVTIAGALIGARQA